LTRSCRYARVGSSQELGARHDTEGEEARWTQEEWDALTKAMRVDNGDPEEWRPGARFSYDWWLMSYLSKQLVKDADAEVVNPGNRSAD